MLYTTTILCLVFIILIIGLLAIYVVLKEKRKDNNNYKPPKWMIPVLIGVCIAGFITSGFHVYIQTVKAKAYSHGLITDDISLKNAIAGTKNSPEEDLPPKELKGSIIIYYKFGCKDCEAIYHNLLSEFKKNNMKVYWISTQSENGKKLLKSYPVEEVPVGIYIRKQNYNDALSYTRRDLFYKDKDTYHIDEESIARLALLQKEGR